MVNKRAVAAVVKEAKEQEKKDKNMNEERKKEEGSKKGKRRVNDSTGYPLDSAKKRKVIELKDKNEAGEEIVVGVEKEDDAQKFVRTYEKWYSRVGAVSVTLTGMMNSM